MKKRTKKRTLWGVGAIGLAAVLSGLFPLYGRFFGRPRLRFPYCGKPLAGAAYAELAAKAGWAQSQLEVAPGARLRGLIRRPRAQGAPWILFYPGNDESQLTRGQAFLSALAGNTDWGLAVFAYRGYDGSDGTSERASLVADAPELFAKFCAAEGLAASRVHLMGFSLGGHMAVHAAAAAKRAGRRAATLTLLAGVNDIVMVRRSPWQRLSPGEDYQTTPYLADVPGPVLVLQGDGDEAFHGPQQGRDIATALGARATYHELPGVGHVSLLSDARALELVRKFIEAHSD